MSKASKLNKIAYLEKQNIDFELAIKRLTSKIEYNETVIENIKKKIQI